MRTSPGLRANTGETSDKRACVWRVARQKAVKQPSVTTYDDVRGKRCFRLPDI